jgi:hypothetical protein
MTGDLAAWHEHRQVFALFKLMDRTLQVTHTGGIRE